MPNPAERSGSSLHHKIQLPRPLSARRILNFQPQPMGAFGQGSFGHVNALGGDLGGRCDAVGDVELESPVEHFEGLRLDARWKAWLETHLYPGRGRHASGEGGR